MYLPAVPLSPLSLVPLFYPLRSANLTIFATPLTGDIWRSKLLSNYFVSCGNVAAASLRSGDSWRLTGLASLALASVICVQFAALRRMEIEKKLLVSFACVASSGNGDYSHKANYRLHASAAGQGKETCLTPCAYAQHPVLSEGPNRGSVSQSAFMNFS